MAIIKVITPSVTDANITTAKVTDNAITLAKMASGTDGNIISYDASGNPVAIATGSDGQVLTSTGAGSPPAFEDAGGGTNTPQFSARASSNQTIANDTLTKVVFGTEIFDPQGTFASSRFTPAVAGNYFMTTSIRFASNTYIPTIQVRLNGTNIYWVSGTKAAANQYINVSFSFAITMDDNDYVEIYARQDSGGNLDIHGGTDVGTVFNGFKLI